jgi:hypothetical protein
MILAPDGGTSTVNCVTGGLYYKAFYGRNLLRL